MTNSKPSISALALIAVTVLAVPTIATAQTATPYKIDRTVLPIQPPPHKVITTMDARDATKPERFEIKAPEGSPNVVIVLIDDLRRRPVPA